MPELRRQEQALHRELQSVVDQAKDRETYLRIAEILTGFLARLRTSATTLDIPERQRIVRLLVKEVLVSEDNITIRHSIPIPGSPGGGPDPSNSGNDLRGRGKLPFAFRASQERFAVIGQRSYLQPRQLIDAGDDWQLRFRLRGAVAVQGAVGVAPPRRRQRDQAVAAHAQHRHATAHVLQFGRWHAASGAVRTPPARGRSDGGWGPRR